MKFLFAIFQYLVPQHLLSRLAGRLADSTSPRLKNFLIRRFVSHYRVNMAEALQEDPAAYASFNAFFTRQLKPGVRPVDARDDSVVSPADGVFSAAGPINGDSLFQAKGKTFSLAALLGGSEGLAERFRDGSFATVYLSPKDYHRVHMPVAAKLEKLIYVPGRLFSVNRATSETIDSLFARNERAVCLFETAAGPMAMILVGAMIVSGIETVWAGKVAPADTGFTAQDFSSRQPPIRFAKGEEMGRFRLGSTVVLLFGPDAVRWNANLAENSPAVLGEAIGVISSRRA